MERRRFLSSAGLGLAAAGLGLVATWPELLSRAFADEGAGSAAGPPDRVLELGRAVERARRDGKPLLVLVVPEDRRAAYQRGRTVGELINHGGPGVHDDLLVCELACATLGEATRVLHLDVKAKDEPAMLLVELDAEGGEFLPATVIELVTAPAMTKDAGDEEESTIRARIATSAAALHAVVAPSPDARAHRAERNRVALGAGARAAIAAGLAGRAVDPELARRGASILVEAASGADEGAKARARAGLDAAAAAMVAERPAGARWAKGEGCGVSIEGDPNPMMVACGMGSVPALSRRFLLFYAE